MNSNCVDTSSCKSIAITQILKSTSNDIFTLFPNPAKDVIHVVLNELAGNSSISILSFDGSYILAQDPSSSEKVEIDISQLESGIYTIQIWHNGRIYSEKFVKE